MDTEFDLEIAGSPEGSTFQSVYQGDPPARVIAETIHHLVVVDLSPLVIGHVLVIPKRAAFSFASLTVDEWNDWLEVRVQLAEALVSLHGSAVFMEHGSDAGSERNACVLHAHMHILPLAEDLTQAFADDGLQTQDVAPGSLREVASGQGPYFYIERYGHVGHLAVLADATTRPPNQYLRRIVMSQLGDPDAYDWSVVVRRNFLRETLTQMRQVLGGRS